MKLVAALLAAIAGVGMISTTAWAQESRSETVALTEAQPIPEDFNQVSVDSRDLDTDPVGIPSSGMFDIRTADIISDISLYSVTRRDFPGLDEIYRDPGPARANWVRVLLRDRGQSQTESEATASDSAPVDANGAE